MYDIASLLILCKNKDRIKRISIFRPPWFIGREASLGQRFRIDIIAELDPDLDLQEDSP